MSELTATDTVGVAHDHLMGGFCKMGGCIRLDFYRDLRRMDMTKMPPSAEDIASGIEAVWLDGWTVGVRGASRARLRAIEVAAQAPILAALRNLLPYTARETKAEGQYRCTVCDADLTRDFARSSAGHDPECEAGAAWDAAYGAAP